MSIEASQTDVEIVEPNNMLRPLLDGEALLIGGGEASLNVA